MSFTSNYLELRKKRKQEEEGKGSNSFSENYLQKRAERLAEEDDIAPVRPASSSAEDIYRSMGSTYKKKEEEDDFWSDLASKMPNSIAAQKRKKNETSGTYFQKGALEDGFSAKNVAKAMLSTGRDLMTDIYAGMAGIVENTIDVGADIVGSVGGAFGAKDFRYDMDEFAKKDIINEQKVGEVLSDINGGFLSKVSQKIIAGDTETEGASFLGEKTDALAQSGGQLVGTMLLQGVGVPWYVTTGVTSFGGEYEHALQEGATHGEANLSAAITAGAEMLSEKLFGGSGLGEKGLINLDGLTKGISNKLVKRLLDYGVDMTAEGFEEIVSQFAGNLGSALYREENLQDILFSEEAVEGYVDSFIGGFALGGVMNVGKVVNSAKTGKDYRTGLTANEQAVFDKVYENEIAEREQDGKKLTSREKAKLYDALMEQMDKGYITTDAIEEVLGGEEYTAFKTEKDNFFASETFQTYKDTVTSEDAQIKELEQQLKDLEGEPNTIGNAKKYDAIQAQIDSLKNSTKRAELKSILDSEAARIGAMKNQLRGNVYEMVKDSKLAESYRELARKNEKYTPDMTKYTDENAKKTIQNIIDSGLGDNTTQFREFADFLARMSTDKGTVFSLTNNEGIAGTEYYHEGYITNGFVTDDGHVTLNMDSPKALNTTVGHEITHVLEGTEFYATLREAVFNYAISKEGQESFNKRLKDTEARYKGKKNTTAEAELTADLIGDYLFTDIDFINNLSVNHRNVFQKIYDEIKYLCKIATAGSKEARELEKVKKAFEDAYRENGKISGNATKYSLENGNIRKYNKRSKYNEAETLFLRWENGSAPVGEVKKFVRNGKTRYYEKTENGCVELSRSQYNERNGAYVENVDRRAEREISEAYDYDASTQRGTSRHSDSYRDTYGNAAIFGQAIREEFPDVSAGSVSSTFGYNNGNDLNQSEYNEEASDESGASFITFSNDYAAIRNFMKDGDTANANPTADPDIRYSVSEDTDGRELSAEQREYFRYAKTIDEQGRLKPFYHGTARADRVGNVFDPSRATSGPMAFFTDNRQIADNYARDKADTSLEYDEMYDDYYTQFRTEINGKNMSVSEAWKYLPASKKAEIRAKAKHVKMDDDYENVIYDENEQYGVGGFDAYTINQHRGNILEALTDSWLESGTIYGEEQLFLDVLKMVGLDNVQYMNPDFRAEKTYEVYLNITNPFDTSKISVEMLDAFRAAAENAEYVEGNSADYWDKRNIPPEQWIARLEDDIKNGTTHTWTSIPDWVTDVLKEKGYDGIFDTGGKGGGVGHTVAIPFYSEQIKDVSNKNPTTNIDIQKSLSEIGEQPRKYGTYNVFGKDFGKPVDPFAEFAPVAETPSASVSETESVAPVVVSEKETPTEAPVYQDEPIPEATQEDTQALFPDDLAPAQAELEQLEAERAEIYSGLETALEHGSANEVEQLAAEYDAITARIRALEAEDRQRANSLDDADVPPEMEAPYYGESKPTMPEDPFADRDEKAVGSQKVKAYQYENPEVKPFFYDAALGMMYDVDNSTHGEKIYNDQLYYESGGEQGWMGTKRHTTTDIAAFKDSYGYTWDQIREAVNDIIEDHGRENNAISKRIEFMLNDRLLYGYTDVDGRQIPPNQEYIDFLREKQINEYSKESFDRYMATADQYAPVAEDIAPVQTAPVVETPAEVAPVTEQYEAIRPKREPQPRMVRADKAESKPRDKQRKWVGTSTESEVVDRQVLPEDLNQELIHYQPISNKKTLGNANAKLNSLGYEKSVSYLEAKFADQKVTLDDIALGERLIQEAIKNGDTKTAGDLIMDISILGTELGQKVQALSIIKRLTPEGQLRMLQRTVERGKTKKDKAYDDVVVTQEMIDKILSAYKEDGSYDQAYLNEMVEDVKQEIADQMKVTAMDKVNAWRYLSMLGNPKTHIRNLVSNVAMRGTVAVKNAVARTIESVAPIGNRTKTWQAATDEVKAFAQKKAVEMKDVLTDGDKYSEDASIKEKRATFKNKILNGIYEFNSDMLSKEDWWFSKPAFVNSLSEYLTANGIRTEQDIKKNPKITAKAIQYATEQSQIATFRQYSWLANEINRIERKNAATNMVVGSILPFKKTPINIAKTGLNYSPLGFAKTLTYDIHQVKNGKMEASELVDHLAQNMTGTALTLVGYMLASSGFLNGAGDDDKEGKYDYQLGKQAYSVNIGGATFSLSWLSPVAMPLFVGANAYEQLVEGKEWNGDVVVETLAQTLDPLSEMSFISSLDSVLSSYDSGIQKFAGIGETMVQNYVTQFVPTLSSQIATVLDDTKRTTKVAGNSKFKFFDETINNLKYKIPFLRETLEPSTDIWGNEVKQTENVLTRAFETFLAPYAKRDDIASAVDEEIKDLYSQTGDGGVIPSVPYNYVNYDGTKYEMSAKEFTRYKETYGQKAYDLLEELFDTDMYQNADSETRADLVNDVYDYAREEAKRFFFERRGIAYTNATEEGEEYYKTNPIKGAIDNNMTPDEYSFSTKYPEKYEFFKANGISYDSYAAADEDGKRAYSWAYENPGKYTMSKAISDDYMTYYGYKQEIADIKENHVGKGEKDVVTDHIFNNMDLDYGQKVILYRSMYDSKADIANYNGDILDYLNSREDISYEDTVTILRELGFEVDSEGNVRW